MIEQLQRCNSVRNLEMVLSASVCLKKSDYFECHRHHYLLLKKQFSNTQAGLSRYSKLWQRYFTSLKSLNSGIGGDQCALASRKSTSTSITENVVILCWNNTISRDSPTDIADFIVNIGSCLCGKSSNISVFIRGWSQEIRAGP